MDIVIGIAQLALLVALAWFVWQKLHHKAGGCGCGGGGKGPDLSFPAPGGCA